MTKIKLIEGGKMPQKMSNKAACYDVFVREIEQKTPDFAIVYLGFKLTPPEGYELSLKPRSSLTKTMWIVQNSPGVGDEDYTGEYQIRFRALPDGVFRGKLTYSVFPYKVGDACGQICLQKTINIDWEKVEDLEKTERGEGGFGSTNAK
jgi:dUTP pyrophosphatase